MRNFSIDQLTPCPQGFHCLDSISLVTALVGIANSPFFGKPGDSRSRQKNKQFVPQAQLPVAGGIRVPGGGGHEHLGEPRAAQDKGGERDHDCLLVVGRRCVVDWCSAGRGIVR